MRRYGKYAAVVALAILIGVAGALGFRYLAPGFKAKEVKEIAKVGEEAKEIAPAPKAQLEAVTPKYRQAVVTVHSAILREEPSLESDRVTYVSQGTSLKVMGSKAGEEEIMWYKVKISDGRECWISGKVVQLKE